ASAEVTAFIAAAMSWAFSPRALSRGSTLDRRQDKLHRAFAAWRQEPFDTEPHRAHGSPTSASSTALRVKAWASPASKAAAAIVVLLRQPIRRPVGLPDRPLSNGRPRTFPGDFGTCPSIIVISVAQQAGDSRNRPRPYVCCANMAII